MQSYSQAGMGNPLAAPRPISHVRLYSPEVLLPPPAVESGNALRPVHKRRRQVISAAAFMAITLSGLTYKALDKAPPRTTPIVQERAPEPPNVRGLLDVIAVGESGGNYNAYLRHPGNNSIIFTSMAVKDVLNWQKLAINDPNIRGSAVGRYQIINKTLMGLVEQHEIDQNRLFDESLQDELALILLEQADLSGYINGTLDADNFAFNISRIWAAVPVTIGNNPNSFYQGYNSNESKITVDAMRAGIATVK